jgi:hypothetical protein
MEPKEKRSLEEALILGGFGIVAGFALPWMLLGHFFPKGDLWAIVQAVMKYGLQNLDWPTTLAVRFFGSVAVSVVLGVWLFALGYRPKKQEIQIEGLIRKEGSDALKAAQLASKAEIKTSEAGASLNDNLTISTQRETNGFLVYGAIGSGKSTFLFNLLAKVAGYNKTAKGEEPQKQKLMLVDWKGEFVERFRGALLYYPMAKGSAVWQVAHDVQTDLEAEDFASQMIPAPKGNQDPFWSQAGRNVLSAIIKKLIRQKPKTWTWGDLYDEATKPLEEIQATVKQYNPHAYEAIAEKSKQTSSVLSQMQAQMLTVLVLGQAEKADPNAPKFSVKSWLASKRQRIIISGSTAYADLCSGYMRALLTFASKQIQAQTDNKNPKWVVVDEMPKIGKCQPILDLLSFGRSKGARCVFVTQDLAQLKDIYGNEPVNALQSMVGTTIIGRTQGGTTANYLCETVLGKGAWTKKNTTHQADGKKSHSEQREERLVVHPAELQSLGVKGKGIVSIVAGFSGLALFLFFPFITLPKLSKYKDGIKLKREFVGIDFDNVPTPEPVQEQTHEQAQEQTQTAEPNKETMEGEILTHALASPVLHASPLGGVLEALTVMNEALGDKTPASHRQGFAIARNVAKRKAEREALALDNEHENEQMEIG